MTDNDIIKALECCSKSSKLGDCIDNKCMLLGEYGCSDWMDNKLLKSALDLINRQKAEIERSQKETIEQSLKQEMYRTTVEEVRAEAITEFAEKVKEKHFEYFNFIFSYPAFCKLTDDIAKEMKGEQK